MGRLHVSQGRREVHGGPVRPLPAMLRRIVGVKGVRATLKPQPSGVKPASANDAHASELWNVGGGGLLEHTHQKGDSPE